MFAHLAICTCNEVVAELAQQLHEHIRDFGLHHTDWRDTSRRVGPGKRNRPPHLRRFSWGAARSENVITRHRRGGMQQRYGEIRDAI
jgi:hypothetical protein